jgi:hypothetical protein
MIVDRDLLVTGRLRDMDRTNAPGFATDVAWLFRASRILKILLAAALVLLSIAIAVGVTTLAQLARGKAENAKLKVDLAAANDRILRVEMRIANASIDLNRITPKAPHVVPAIIPITLTPEETALVRAVIKLPPPPPGIGPSITIGDAVPEGKLMPIPEIIADKLPKLRGAKFATDRNQTIVIVGAGNRAQLLISPN